MRHLIQYLTGSLCLSLCCGCSESDVPLTKTTDVKSRTTTVIPRAATSSQAVGSDRGDDKQDTISSLQQDVTRPRYPCFPSAGPRQPAWIATDAPFDLVEYFGVPDFDDNAESIYLDALFEFSPDIEVCFGSLDRKLPEAVQQRVARAKKRSQQLLQFSDQWLEARPSLNINDVDRWLADYMLGFGKLFQAQQRSQCVFEVGLDLVALLPHLSAAREVAHTVEWRTRRDLTKGNIDRPIRDVSLLLRLSRDLRPRAGELGQLTSISIDRIVE